MTMTSSTRSRSGSAVSPPATAAEPARPPRRRRGTPSWFEEAWCRPEVTSLAWVAKHQPCRRRLRVPQRVGSAPRDLGDLDGQYLRQGGQLLRARSAGGGVRVMRRVTESQEFARISRGSNPPSPKNQARSKGDQVDMHGASMPLFARRREGRLGLRRAVEQGPIRRRSRPRSCPCRRRSGAGRPCWA